MDHEHISANSSNTEYTDMEIFLAILEVMSEKVSIYNAVTQNRLAMVREDLVSSIVEETISFDIRMISGIQTIQECVNCIENAETFPASQEDSEFVQKFCNAEENMKMLGIKPIQFNLNSEELQEGFNRASSGEYVNFRQLIMRRQ